MVHLLLLSPLRFQMQYMPLLLLRMVMPVIGEVYGYLLFLMVLHNLLQNRVLATIVSCIMVGKEEMAVRICKWDG